MRAVPALEEGPLAAFSELAPAREVIYAFLSLAFRDSPDCGQLQAFRRAALGEGAVESIMTLLNPCLNPAVSGEAWELEARREFMQLFKVPGGRYVAPYESVFRDTREIEGKQVCGLLMGQAAIDVQKWYQLAALELAPGSRELPDHIALELSYVGHLCRKEQEFLACGNLDSLNRTWEMQRDFLAGHLAVWIRPLRDTIWEKSEHGYFRALAEFLVDFVSKDLATLEGLLGPSLGSAVPRYAR
ncbi:MAG: molecular chaperone TorD family protein [Candidatus Hydrogenedentes bacterium]|nr:molecular chaperone TorD family protein [Candidatus Hydrogenedentota bacterium]